MSNDLTLHRQWASRPADERFNSLLEMQAKMHAQRAISRASVTSSRRIRAVPLPDHRGLVIEGQQGVPYAPSNWAFGQVAALVGAPAAYLRTLPAELAADALNFGLQVARGPEDMGVLLQKGLDGNTGLLRAATGPRYGRIWNCDIVDHLVDRFGDGVNGQWRVPGVFGQRVQVNKDTTTLFAGDRDMFVFLADEDKRVPVQTRVGDPTSEGMLYRGFMVSNSEVGAATLSISLIAYDGICGNRIIWDAHNLGSISIRHTASAPDRFLEEAQPALEQYVNSSVATMVDTVEIAQQTRVDKLDEFLATRFGPRVAQRIVAAHEQDEGRPMETVWDVVTGVTAHARSIPFQADRVEVERQAGKLLEALAV